MAWTNPVTWALNAIPHSSDFNQQIRDNINYLYALVSPVAKFAIQRQGGDPNNWQTAGTNNYAPTDAYIQCGMVNVSFNANWQMTPVTVTLPTALNSGVVMLTGADPGAAKGIWYSAIFSGASFTLDGYANANITLNTTVQWLVIGR